MRGFKEKSDDLHFQILIRYRPHQQHLRIIRVPMQKTLEIAKQSAKVDKNARAT